MFTAWKLCIFQYPADGLEKSKDAFHNHFDTLSLKCQKRQKRNENCGQDPHTLGIHGACLETSAE